jgi:nucleoside-diphosphate-sugar epimerase
MPHVLIAGCGDLGGKLAELLVAYGAEVSGLRRKATPLPAGVRSLQGDVTQAESLHGLAAVKPDFLVYCVAAGEQSDENYRAVYVQGLYNVLLAVTPAQSLKHVFFVSSTRVYGQNSGTILNEATEAKPADFGGVRLLEAEYLIRSLPCPGTVLRLSGIYGDGRTHMLKLARQPERWQRQNPWTNRIHRDDAARFIAFLLDLVIKKQPLDPCYVVTDSRPAPQWVVLLWLAEQMKMNINGLTAPPVAGGKRLSNFRMRLTGFELKYEDYKAGYAGLLGKE